jgi:membrane protease YdiL (CAAX protease family)
MDNDNSTLAYKNKRLIEISKLLVFYGIPLIVMAFSFTSIPRIIPIIGNQYLIMFAVLILAAFDNYFTEFWREYKIFGNIRRSLRLSIFLMSLVMFVYLMIYILDFYPKGDLSELNRGIPSMLYVVMYIFFLVPLQQLFVWGDFRTRLKYLHLPKSIEYLIISIFYASTHLFYPDNFLIVSATFAIGFFWSYIQDRTDSIIGNMLCHIVFGLGAFVLNLA